MISLVFIGLPVIALAWLVQLFYAFKGKNDIRPEFIILYMVGVALLVLGDFMTNLTVLSYLEMGTLVAALLVLIYRIRK
jgi:hypothetical protein